MDRANPGDRDGDLLLADSFRVSVREGRPSVRGLAHHLGRFTAGAVRLGVDDGERLAFLGHAREEIAAFGAGFPRLEVRAARGGADASSSASAPFLALALRALPELGETVDLRSIRREAPRLANLKGPLISAYRELNLEAGAEALLCDHDGSAREGTTTALLAWDGDTLIRSASLDRVQSVTEALVCDIAAAQRRPITAAALTPALLSGAELWAVNALHGIRAVRSLDGRVLPAGDRNRLAEFRAALDERWEPLRIR